MLFIHVRLIYPHTFWYAKNIYTLLLHISFSVTEKWKFLKIIKIIFDLLFKILHFLLSLTWSLLSLARYFYLLLIYLRVTLTCSLQLLDPYSYLLLTLTYSILLPAPYSYLLLTLTCSKLLLTLCFYLLLTIIYLNAVLMFGARFYLVVSYYFHRGLSYCIMLIFSSIVSSLSMVSEYFWSISICVSLLVFLPFLHSFESSSNFVSWYTNIIIFDLNIFSFVSILKYCGDHILFDGLNAISASLILAFTKFLLPKTQISLPIINDNISVQSVLCYSKLTTWFAVCWYFRWINPFGIS